MLAHRLLLVVLCALPTTIVSAQSPDHRSFSDLELEVDAGIRPGDDFFGYANGQWLKQARIPAGRDRWTTRNEIDTLTRHQLSTLLDGVGTAPSGSLARRVADFLTAYRDEATIERRGLAPIRAALDSITRIRNKRDLASMVGREIGSDVDPLNWGIFRSAKLLGLSVEPGLHGEPNNVAFLLQGGLGLPDREFYLGSDPKLQAARTDYEKYIGHLLRLVGAGDATQRAHDVMALETALASGQVTAEASADDHYTVNRWSRADFTRKAPGMDWPAFFVAAGLQRQDTLVPWQPSAVISLAALIGSQPLAVWQDYLRVRLLDEYAEVLPRAVARDSKSTGSDSPDRAQLARDAVHASLSDAVGQLYAERYFPAERKARIETMVGRVIEAFRHRIQAVNWMSPASKATALAKLQLLYFGVGFPDRWVDHTALIIDPADAVGNMRRIAQWKQRRMTARLGQKADRTEWWIPTQRVGAILNFQLNSYNFPAALLQPGKFDPEASDAANYGAIGAIVGHEVSHFVDLLGADYDVHGEKRHWWTAQDRAGFELHASRLGAQVAAYRPLGNLVIDTTLTRTENVADLGGLAAAFDAWRGSVGSRASDTAWVRQQDRQFFLGFARSWRGMIRDEAMPGVLSSDTHAPERYRVATVRNLDAWYAAFDVQPGQQLYLPPEARVRIW